MTSCRSGRTPSGGCVALSRRDRRLLAWLAVGVGAALSLWGLVDVYLVPLQWWRDSGVPGWFRQQLSLDYGPGLSHLPENWVYNTGDENHPLRRLVSTFLSPLATAYLLVVVLVFLASRQPARAAGRRAAVACFAGLLWTHTRAATLALALGLLLLAAAQRRWLPVVAAAAVVAVSVGFFAAYSSIGPGTKYTAERARLPSPERRRLQAPASGDAFSANESSLSSHWRNLRDGLRTVVHHPQGFGLGNAGTEAKRTDVTIIAGESTYTELGVETGLAGMLVFAAWGLAVLRGLWSRSPGSSVRSRPCWRSRCRPMCSASTGSRTSCSPSPALRWRRGDDRSKHRPIIQLGRLIGFRSIGGDRVPPTMWACT